METDGDASLIPGRAKTAKPGHNLIKCSELISFLKLVKHYHINFQFYKQVIEFLTKYWLNHQVILVFNSIYSSLMVKKDSSSGYSRDV